MARFSDEQIRRYSRQILLREVGGHGQGRLGAARPVLLCPGEVGQLAAAYLWRAGVTQLTLLSSSAAAAVHLTEYLVASGYPGPPAQALAQAPKGVQQVAAAAPGFTLLWLESAEPDAEAAADPWGSPALLWAYCCGTAGVVGQGAAALRQTAASHPDPAAVASGPAAMVIGSALALCALQRIIGTGQAPSSSPDAVWHIDTASPALPEWQSSSA